jgi:hypothetical protein
LWCDGQGLWGRDGPPGLASLPECPPPLCTGPPLDLWLAPALIAAAALVFAPFLALGRGQRFGFGLGLGCGCFFL